MKSRRSTRGAPLGQHFLTGQWAARSLARAANVHSDEVILEIGPGKGALTRELLKYGMVIAVEKDAGLVEELQHTFKAEHAKGELKIIQRDVRAVTPESLNLTNYVVAANIPYYITGEIIRQFLTAATQPRAMALLVQKEVAQRILARDGKESILSLSVKVYGTPTIVEKVSRGNFSPAPSVDSAILLIDDVSRARFASVGEEAFFKAVRAGFASKRKYLRNNLTTTFGKERVLAAFDALTLSEKTRAEDVPFEMWLCLARELT